MSDHIDDYFVLSKVRPASLLKEQVESNDSELELTRLSGAPAVYMWVKKMAPPTQAIANQQAFSSWIQSSLQKTDGMIEGALGHLGRVQFTLGGRSISADKVSALGELGNTFERRKLLQKFLTSFDYCLALYVGETKDLATRIADHLSGHTDFAKRLQQYGHDWTDVGLRYVLLPPDTTQTQRQALERFIAALALAPATSRAG